MRRRTIREWFRDFWVALSPSPGDWLGETREQQLERRVNALEIHIRDLEDRFHPIDRYIGQTAREAFIGNAGDR